MLPNQSSPHTTSKCYSQLESFLLSTAGLPKFHNWVWALYFSSTAPYVVFYYLIFLCFIWSSYNQKFVFIQYCCQRQTYSFHKLKPQLKIVDQTVFEIFWQNKKSKIFARNFIKICLSYKPISGGVILEVMLDLRQNVILSTRNYW